jgi:DNA-binding NarL/FixJ family response regulator
VGWWSAVVSLRAPSRQEFEKGIYRALLVLLPVEAGLSRRAEEGVEMLKLLVERSIGHGGAAETRATSGMVVGSRPAARGLLERDGELARIDQAITALVRGHGGVLVIQGAAGIGKSALVEVLCEHAAEQRLQTLTARGSELERDFGFGVVRQLLETRVVRAGESERAELLAGAAGLADPVLGLGGGNVGNSFAALHGLYWLVANLTNSGPVVLAVDDLQWADEPSLRWLVYLCHRLEGVPVLVAASTRPPRPGHSPLLAELLAVGGVQVLCPGPLSESAVAQLVGEGLGAQPDPMFIAAGARVSGGNPFVLRELIFDLAADGVAPVAAHAASLGECVPGQVERVVLARLGRLDQTSVRLAQAVAVLGESSGLRRAAALAGLDIDAAAGEADALVTAELLGAGRPLRFVHPLMRSAVYEQIPSGVRSRAHVRAARLLAGEGVEPEQVAVQLLACEPAGDADTVQALRKAAAAALARGAPETAVTYLRRALAEPPTESVRAAVLGELGGAERISRDPAAVVHLEQAWRATIEPVARARLAGQLANVLFFGADLTRSFAVLQAGLDDLGHRDPDLATLLHVHKALELVCGVGPTEAPEVTLGRLRELAARGTPGSRSAQLALANLLSFRGESCQEVAQLVERGWDDGRFLAEETSEAVAAIMAVLALVQIDELNRAQALAEAMLADAQARGSVLGFVAATGRRGMVALRRGELADAEADIRAAFELATEHNLTLSVAAHAAYLGLTLLERGDLKQAAAVVEDVTLIPALLEMPFGPALLETRGRVRLARGQREQAIADLRHCGHYAARFQAIPNFYAWRSALALALIAEQPQEAWELAQAELELARRARTPRAIGIALRVCGLLTGGSDGIELLEQSVAVLESTPMQLELAHSLTELGAALRRAGARIAAREPLRQALDLAARCGARPLAARARDEALAAGARPRRPWTTGVHALTPSELRVARLAAQPLSTREIAQALFITTKTVSDHLSSTYRKLNIHTRDQLTTAMTAHTSPSTP